MICLLVEAVDSSVAAAEGVAAPSAEVVRLVSPRDSEAAVGEVEAASDRLARYLFRASAPALV